IEHIQPATLVTPLTSVSPEDVVADDGGPGGVQEHSRTVARLVVLDQVVLDQGTGIAADVESAAKLTVVLVYVVSTDGRRGEFTIDAAPVARGILHHRIVNDRRRATANPDASVRVLEDNVCFDHALGVRHLDSVVAVTNDVSTNRRGAIDDSDASIVVAA